MTQGPSSQPRLGLMPALATATRAVVVTLVVCGLVYPMLVTAVAQLLFPSRAQGSLVTDRRGVIVGSELIGQSFVSPAYFQPRPSAGGYDGLKSGASNLGPTSQGLRDRLEADVARLRAENPGAPDEIPVDLVTASGSGLDPHLSPAAARWQAPRVAQARGIALSRLLSTLDAETRAPLLGFIGGARVNVLELNLALDRQFGRPAPRAEVRPQAPP